MSVYVHNIAPPKYPVGSESDFVRREIAHWGEDYVDDLINKGFVPVLLNENGSLKWQWRLCDSFSDR